MLGFSDYTTSISAAMLGLHVIGLSRCLCQSVESCQAVNLCVSLCHHPHWLLSVTAQLKLIRSIVNTLPYLIIDAYSK